MTPLVLLPGMMCDARLFSHQIAHLSASRAIHVAPIDGYDTMEALANDVLQHAPPFFALAGLSMGGIVAMEMLRLAPERIEKIALLDTNPLAEITEVQVGRAHQIASVRAGGLEQVMREDMKPNYLANGPDRAAILELCMRMAQTLGPEVFIRQSIALRDRPDQQATLAATTIPALILCGADDRLCPVSRHELMHQLMPGSQLEIIKNAAHLPTLEQPEATNRALSKWLCQSNVA